MALAREGLFDGDDELGKDGQKLVGISFDQFFGTLDCEEFVRLLGFSKSLEEDRQMEVVV